MNIVTTNEVPGKKIEKALGVVRGNTIRAKWFGKDIVAGFRQMVGGELKEYTEMLTEAREQAMDRMVKEAEKLGANAIVNVRFTSAQVMATAAEILVYGTAVIVK